MVGIGLSFNNPVSIRSISIVPAFTLQDMTYNKSAFQVTVFVATLFAILGRNAVGGAIASGAGFTFSLMGLVHFWQELFDADLCFKDTVTMLWNSTKQQICIACCAGCFCGFGLRRRIND